MQERSARRSVIASRTRAPGPSRTQGASGAGRACGPSMQLVSLESFSSSAGVPLVAKRAWHHLQRQSAGFAQVELSSAEIGERFDAQELVLARPPQRGQVALSQFLETFFQLTLIQRVQHDEALAFLLIGHGGDNKGLVPGARHLLQAVLDFDVGHPLAPTFCYTPTTGSGA